MRRRWSQESELRVDCGCCWVVCQGGCCWRVCKRELRWRSFSTWSISARPLMKFRFGEAKKSGSVKRISEIRLINSNEVNWSIWFERFDYYNALITPAIHSDRESCEKTSNPCQRRIYTKYDDFCDILVPLEYS